MDEAKLIGWLCFWSNQIDRLRDEGRDDVSVWVPHVVSAGWQRLGLVEGDGGEKDWRGSTMLTITEKGLAAIDLYGPEWGFDTIPTPSEQGG